MEQCTAGNWRAQVWSCGACPSAAAEALTYTHWCSLPVPDQRNKIPAKLAHCLPYQNHVEVAPEVPHDSQCQMWHWCPASLGSMTRKTDPTFLLSVTRWRSFTTFTSAVSVLWWLLHADWSGQWRECSVMCSFIWPTKTCSVSLPTWKIWCKTIICKHFAVSLIILQHSQSHFCSFIIVACLK